MMTRSPRDDLFEEFIASLVGRTKELQSALAMSAIYESANSMNVVSTPRSCQALTPTLNASPQGLPVSWTQCRQQSDTSIAREQPLASDLAFSSSPPASPPTSPRSLQPSQVPSPRAHSPDVPWLGSRTVEDLIQKNFSPYRHRNPGNEKLHRAAVRWERIIRELRSKNATHQLAMLRSVWLLSQEGERLSLRVSSSPSCQTMSFSDTSRRMGDVSKYEGTFLNHLVRHPDKLFTSFYVYMITVVAAYDLVSFPFMLTFETEQTPYRETLMTLAWLSAAIWSLDLPMSCLQGFYTAEGVVEMRLGHTCLQYLRSWFFFDLIVNVSDWLTWIQMSDNDNGVWQFTRVLRMLRFFRLVRLLRSLEKMKNIMIEGWSSDYFLLVVRLVFLLFVILFISHYIACAWLAVANQLIGSGVSSWIQIHDLENSDPLLQYVASLHWCLTQFTPATTNIAPTNGQERVFAIIVVMFGLVMFSTFVSSLTSAVVELKRMRNSRSAEEMQIRRYMKSKRVPLHICQRIWAYYKKQYRARTQIITESTITFFHHMPTKLRRDLQFNVYFPVLSQHPVFEHCYHSNDNTVLLICGKAVTEQWIPNGQEAFSVGDMGAYMFFLESGEFSYSCPLYMQEEKRVIAPHFIAEATLWTKWHHRGTLVAEAPCDVLRLCAAELEAMFSARQKWTLDAAQGLRKYATLYAHRTSVCDACEDASVDPITDLMMQFNTLSEFASKAFGDAKRGNLDGISGHTFEPSPSKSFLHYFRAGSRGDDAGKDNVKDKEKPTKNEE